MTTITALIKRHPLPAYYTLTFAISWGGRLMVIGDLADSRAPPSRRTG